MCSWIIALSNSLETGSSRAGVVADQAIITRAAQDVYGQVKESASDAVEAIRESASGAEDFLRTTIEERPYGCRRRSRNRIPDWPLQPPRQLLDARRRGVIDALGAPRVGDRARRLAARKPTKRAHSELAFLRPTRVNIIRAFRVFVPRRQNSQSPRRAAFTIFNYK
jgi:hypothetical protein